MAVGMSHPSRLKPRRHRFDLSHVHKLTCDMGELIPVCNILTVPGDYIKLSARATLRFQPMFAPVMHNIRMKIWYFYVPVRLICEKMGVDFEKFITGGVTGNETVVLPRWTPTNTQIGSLWDYFGFPTGVTPQDDTLEDGTTFYASPLDFLRTAYNLVFNEYFRDENVDSEVELTSEVIQYVRWFKDYFTSSLPWQQRGTAPALPVEITGESSAFWSLTDNPHKVLQLQAWAPSLPSQVQDRSPLYIQKDCIAISNPGPSANISVGYSDDDTSGQYAPIRFGASLDDLNVNVVDGSKFTASTFDVADQRLAFQIQKWMERNARAGARYTEYLQAHFGVSPTDDRLQRPEYIGGSVAPVVISEVLQTSATSDSGSSTAQGNMAGHGIVAGSGRIGDYFCKEFGVIIGLISVIPDATYQQGINRQWLMQSRYDWYAPEFANLSEQEVWEEEIFAQASDGNAGIFGFQGRYNELRYMPSVVCGEMRDTLDYWHLGRKFPSAPNLNSAFLICNPDKRIFSVQDEDGLIVEYGNIISAARPLPKRAEPGLIDHTYGGI